MSNSYDYGQLLRQMQPGRATQAEINLGLQNLPINSRSQMDGRATNMEVQQGLHNTPNFGTNDIAAVVKALMDSRPTQSEINMGLIKAPTD